MDCQFFIRGFLFILRNLTHVAHLRFQDGIHVKKLIVILEQKCSFVHYTFSSVFAAE